MAFFRPLVLRIGTRPAKAVKTVLQGVPKERPAPGFFSLALGSARRGFSSTLDPYKTLGLNRDASDAEIKKAYRDQALRWHPDKQPEGKREEAQKRFSDAANAYEILKDPEKRQQYDLTGRVGGGGAPGPNGAGGINVVPLTPEEVERVFRDHFGQQGMEELLRFFPHGGQPRQRPRGSDGGGRPAMPRPAMPRQQGVLQADMEVRVFSDVQRIHQASRESRISTEFDERRAHYAGKVGTIVKVDPSDFSIKLRVMVSPGRADEVWFGAGAVWNPSDLEPGTDVQIAVAVEVIHAASRVSGIGMENDGRRARCAGKVGTVVDIDHHDQSVKIRVLVLHGRADELWFGMGAFDPAQRLSIQNQRTWVQPPEAERRGFSSPF